jgi:four helix bundle protein
MAKEDKIFDLEKRTLEFSKRTLKFLRGFSFDTVNNELIKQLTRSSTSIGANYIEANESHSKKDFGYRVRVCRKEAKETRYWLELIECNEIQEIERKILFQEATELMKIMGSILKK